MCAHIYKACQLKYMYPHAKLISSKARRPKMSITDMASKARELKELKRMAEELEAESKALEDEIKAEMEARDTAEITADIFKIRWTRVVSNRLDTQSVNNRFTRLLSVFMWASIPQKNPGTVPEKGLINKKVPIPGTRYISKRETGFEPAALALARRKKIDHVFAFY